MDEDVYFKKEIAYRYHGHNMRFRVSQDLFSSYQIDIGTQFLLRTLISETDIGRFSRVLDLGCGYGPIGISLKTLTNDCELHMADRDALAVEYARQNAELNGLQGVQVYGSLGYDDVTGRDFDLLVSNIPGKAGEPVITDFLREAAGYLDKDGMAAVVVITPLEDTVAGILENTPDAEVLFHKNRSGHAVFHYRFRDSTSGQRQLTASGFERGIYRHESVTVSCQGLNYRINTAYDIPEDKAPGHLSELLIEAITKLKNPAIDRILLFNPGQGHVAAAAWKELEPGDILLVDRDLLSLRVSESNLVLNGCPGDRIHLFHQTGIGSDDTQNADLIIGTIRENEGVRAINTDISRIADRLAPGGKALLSASSTAITRIVTGLPAQKKLVVKKREKHKGNSLLVLERK